MPPQSASVTLQSPNTIVAQSIQWSEAYQTRLKSLRPSTEELARSGYRLSQFTDQEVNSKKRCARCSKAIKPRKDERFFTEQILKYNLDKRALPDLLQSNGTDAAGNSRQEQNPNPNTKNAVCVFHPGRWDRQTRSMSCCGRNGGSPGCRAADQHQEMVLAPGELASYWRIHPTANAYNNFNHRPAVAVDCEMGTAVSGDTELIRVSLVDYFNGSVLIDNLVWPDVPMAHYNTKYSGVTRKDMEDARRARSCIFGRDHARMLCQQFVGPNTIIVGHSAQNDLMSLRWMHTNIVDTYLIEAAKIKEEEGIAAAAAEREALENGDDAEIDDAVAMPIPDQSSAPQQAVKPKKKPKGTGRLALKTLARELLGREIQTKDRLGHDSLEDAIAARDLAHWYVTHPSNVQTTTVDPSTQPRPDVYSTYT